MRTAQPRAEQGLGLCQSQGSYGRYKSIWKDGAHGSLLSFDPKINTKSPIEGDDPGRSIKTLPSPDCVASTRSLNPSVNVRTCNVYGLN